MQHTPRMQSIKLLSVLLVVALVLPGSSHAQLPPTCNTASTALASQLQQLPTELPSCMQISETVVLRWGIKGDVITFGVEAQLPPDTAYFGIGLSELGSMKGADIALFNASSNGTWILIDAYAPGFEPPVADQLQNVKLLGVQFSNSTFVAAWQRHLAPCDQQDLPIKSVPLHVIWAHGSEWRYHGNSNRGSKMVSFMDDNGPVVTASSGPEGNVTADPNVKMLEVSFPVEIPEQTTSYLIKYFKLPSDKKYHVLKYEAVGNSSLLHHGVLYSCSPAQGAEVAALPSMGPFDRLKPDFKMLCEQFYMLVTPNLTYTVPPTAGLPMGTPTSQYVALELHYNNPEGLTGQVDSGGGLRVYYTDKLRQHDMGLLTLNQPEILIPPGEPTVVGNVSVCPSNCTARFKGPVALLNGIFHMHGTGKSAITRHYRNGSELAPIAQLREFDYEFQGATGIGAQSRTLLPGDALTLQCTFDSTDRTNVTRGGLATDDEMCFYWISYYPAQEDMGFCFSVGAIPAAICGATYPPQLAQINATNAQTVIPQLMQEGVLMPAQDPANYSTHYKDVCNPSPVV